MTGQIRSEARGEIIVWTGSGTAPALLKGAVFAIGNFDGVHLGHKALIAEAARMATSLGCAAGLVTFEPHPRSVFRPEAPVFRLTPASMRRQLVAEFGCHAIAELVFDRTFLAQSADTFVADLLVGKLAAAGIVVGDDFAYGKGRTGTALTLRAAFEALSRPVSIVAPVHDASGMVVSSSRIRDALARGDIAIANAMLGHRWRIDGEVVHGDKRGRLLGYPTANMVLAPDNQLKHGIYAVRIRIDGVWRPGVASFGRRPTFDDGAPRLETFVFDFSGNLYGRHLDVEFVGWIRGEEKFASIDDLIVQMNADSVLARQLAA